MRAYGYSENTILTKNESRQCSLASHKNITEIKKKKKGIKAMANQKAKKKYVVTVKETIGTLDTDIFRKMASKGDITSVSVTEFDGQVFTVTGEAYATIETEEKMFDMAYFNTEEYGIIHCGGGTLFDESISDYLTDDIKKFRVIKVKCKMGNGYKAVPVLE